MKKIIYPLVFAFFVAGCGLTDNGDTSDNGEVPEKLACANGWTEYSVQDTPMKFCYDPAWGEPKVESLKAKTGEIKQLSFSNAADGPFVTYHTYNYEPATEGMTAFDFNGLRVTAPDEEMKAQIVEALSKTLNFDESELNVRKADVGKIKSVRVHVKYTAKVGGAAGDEVRYYVPAAFEGYHVMIWADNSQAAAVDNLVYDFVIK